MLGLGLRTPGTISLHFSTGWCICEFEDTGLGLEAAQNLYLKWSFTEVLIAYSLSFWINTMDIRGRALELSASVETAPTGPADKDSSDQRQPRLYFLGEMAPDIVVSGSLVLSPFPVNRRQCHPTG